MEGKETNRGQEVLLTTVSDENEANIVQSLLRTNGIPSLRKHRGNGEYLQISMGVSYLGIDIFVMASKYDEAKALLDSDYTMFTAESGDSLKLGSDELQEAGEEVFLERKNRSLMVFLMYLAVALIFMVLATIYSKVRFL